jgi:hypothetical protein
VCLCGGEFALYLKHHDMACAFFCVPLWRVIIPMCAFVAVPVWRVTLYECLCGGLIISGSYSLGACIFFHNVLSLGVSVTQFPWVCSVKLYELIIYIYSKIVTHFNLFILNANKTLYLVYIFARIGKHCIYFLLIQRSVYLYFFFFTSNPG